MKKSIFDYKDLFTFLLDCYEELDSSIFKEIIPANNIWDFEPYKRQQKGFYSFNSLCQYLDKKGYLNSYSNKKFLTRLLKFVDKNIHVFDEYDSLFIKNSDDVLKNDKYVLIIQTSKSVRKQIDIYLSLKEKNKKEKGLRKERYFNPRKTCHKLGLINLNFVERKQEFEIKQSFFTCDLLSNELERGFLSFTLAPFIKIEENGSPLYRTIEDTNCNHFSIEYKNEIEKEYEKYLRDSFKSANGLLIIPEICNPFSDSKDIYAILNSMNIDKKKIVVSGTNWCNGENICYVFDDQGEVLCKQKKYNPFFYEKDSKNDEDEKIKVYEDLTQNNQCLEIDLLNVKKFGVIGFPICADLLDAKYIESVYCDCRVTNIVAPCMSKSKDIVSSLSSLSSLYGINIIVCNSCMGDNRFIGYCSLPRKMLSTNQRSFSELCYFSKTKKNEKFCKQVVLNIDLKKYAH